MQLPEPKKETYNLKELKEKWKCPMSDFFDYAKEGILQIYKQQNRAVFSVFASDKEKAAASKFNSDPIPINHQEAKQLEKEYRLSSAYNDLYPDKNEAISLVLTYEEKNRFEKERCNSLRPYDQEEYPGLPGEPLLIGWRAICPHFGLKVGIKGKKPKGMNHHIKTENFPLMRMPNGIKPCMYLSQIKKYLASFQKK